MSSTTTPSNPVGRTQHHQYSKLACGFSTPDFYLQVLGLSAAPTPGLPFVASLQNSSSFHGDWTPSHFALTGAAAPAALADLTVCQGANSTEAVGLGSDGQIYRVGHQVQCPTWIPGAGLIAQPTKFSTGSLTSQLMNRITVFAVSSSGAAWVAAYHDMNDAWQPGYALPTPNAATYQWLGARPDLSSAGTTHAIGLTTDGKASEAAFASGPGAGFGNWTAGKGILGNVPGMHVFTQLLLVSGDAAGNFHVIGLCSDGSVWDIDQYSATAASPAWSGVSTKIVAAGSVNGSRIDFYLSTPAPAGSIVLNLVARSGAELIIIANYSASWTPCSTTIPTSGAAPQWQIINNLASGNGIFILGLAVTGLVYELAYCKDGTWTAGTQTPIS